MRRIPLWLTFTALLLALSPAHAAEDPAQPGNVAPQTPATDAGLLQNLEAYQWTLTAATNGTGSRIETLFPTAGRPYIFNFSAAMLNVQGGCNTFSGGYLINTQGHLQAGTMGATMMACEPALMQADAALAALLAQPLQIEFIPGGQPQLAQLQLRTASNETLALNGVVTREAQYGAGTVIFLEIDARQLACRNPRNGQTTCLQARAVEFDEQGLRVPPPGPWQPFYDTIEGYSHTSGVRNVVRVKRFDRGAVPGGTAQAIYVLDLIVESETMPPWQSGS